MDAAVEENQMELLTPTAEYITSALECPKRLREICRRQKQGMAATKRRNPNLWLFEQARPPIRARLLRVSQPRRYREGQKPVSLGTKPLNQKERIYDDLLRWELGIIGVYQARPKLWGDCSPRPCPWCKAPVTMRINDEEEQAAVEQAAAEPVVVEDTESDEQAHITCPDCKRRVLFALRPDGDGWRWKKYDARVTRLEPHEVAPYLRALNHCDPCPHLTCRHNLFKDEEPETGIIKLIFPVINESGRLVDFADRTKDSCSLRMAELAEAVEGKEKMTLEEIGRRVNLTQERVNQVLRRGLKKFDESDVAYEAASDD